MTINEIQNIINEKSNKLKDLKVKSLAVFGSFARGEIKPDSDIDILVEFDGPPTFDGYMDLLFFLEDITGKKVDLVTYDALKPRIKPSILKDAVYVA